MENQELLNDFKSESLELISQLMPLLEEVEEDHTKNKRLEEFGQIIDRLMGTAKSFAEMNVCSAEMNKIGSFAELCKIVGYRSSQIGNNENLTNIVVAFLMDAIESLEEMIGSIDGARAQLNMSEFVTNTFLDRLKWLSSQFDQNLRATVGTSATPNQMGQMDIDQLLKKMGIG